VVFLLILESLGSTELLFILVMALVFFGPRKLPQLSRSLGKNLAEFRKASEDFKHTWEKEVRLEEYDIVGDMTSGGMPAPGSGSVASHAVTEENSILDHENPARSLKPPMIEAIMPDRVIARHTAAEEALSSPDKADLASNRSDLDGPAEDATASPKHDWL
jgi:Tat protein translocase TatB subunit